MTIAKMAAPAAKAVLRQATALRPLRSKLSDGLLPSLAHQKQNPSSDHNTGFAVDLTHDKLGGIDCHEIFEKIKGDKRIKYIIFNGLIWSPDRAGEGNRPYDGANKHKHHLHISIKTTCGDDVSPWFPWMGKPKVVNTIKSKVKKLPKKVI